MPVINAEERTDLQNCMHQIISSLFADEEYAFEVFILMKGDRKLKNLFSTRVRQKIVTTRK